MHTCPDCGQACYCHGDIDDHENPNEELMCEHCDRIFDGDEAVDDEF